MERTRRRFVEEGLPTALARWVQRRPSQRPKFDGEAEAHLIALAGSRPPQGHGRWSLRLLADRIVALGRVGSGSSEERARHVGKNGLEPWLKLQQWCIPPAQSAACGPPWKTCWRVTSEPLAGGRHALVRERRTPLDFAAVIKTLCDELSPSAEEIVLVMDQLNTHGVASLSEAFAPAPARRLACRLEIHHPPKHGSWLNMAEIEPGVLSRRCLCRRVPTQELLASETTAWQNTRNAQATAIDWRFITADARIKLERPYPSLNRDAL